MPLTGQTPNQSPAPAAEPYDLTTPRIGSAACPCRMRSRMPFLRGDIYRNCLRQSHLGVAGRLRRSPAPSFAMIGSRSSARVENFRSAAAISAGAIASYAGLDGSSYRPMVTGGTPSQSSSASTLQVHIPSLLHMRSRFLGDALPSQRQRHIHYGLVSGWRGSCPTPFYRS